MLTSVRSIRTVAVSLGASLGLALAAAVAPVHAVTPAAPAVPAPAAAGWVDAPYPQGSESAASIAASWATGQTSWHVGTRLIPSDGTVRRTVLGLVMRCDGTVCTHLEPPAPTTAVGSTTHYSAVGGTGPDDVWVGGDTTATATSELTPLLWHWDGTSWAAQTVPAAHDGSTVYGITTTTPGGGLDVLVRETRSQRADLSIAYRVVGGVWTRVPLQVPGCVAPDPAHPAWSHEANVLGLARAGAALAVTGTCHTSDQSTSVVGYAALRAGAVWQTLPYVGTTGAATRYRSLAAGPGATWFAQGGAVVLRQDRRGTHVTRLPGIRRDAVDVDSVATSPVSGDAAWVVGRAAGRTALWRWSARAWQPVPAPDAGTDGRRAVVVLADGTVVVVDTSGLLPALSLLAPAAVGSAVTPAVRVTKPDEPARAASAAAKEPPLRVRLLPQRADGDLRYAGTAAVGPSTWLAGVQRGQFAGQPEDRPVVLRCGDVSCAPHDPPAVRGAQLGITSFSAMADDNVWVSYRDYASSSTLVLRWDGMTWSRVPVPSSTWQLSVTAAPGGSAWLSSVSRGQARLARWVSGSWVDVPVGPLAVPGADCARDAYAGAVDANGEHPLATIYCRIARDRGYLGALVELVDGVWTQRLAPTNGIPTAWFGGGIVTGPDAEGSFVLLDADARFPYPSAGPTTALRASPDGRRLWAFHAVYDGRGNAPLLAMSSIGPNDAAWTPRAVPRGWSLRQPGWYGASTPVVADDRLIGQQTSFDLGVSRLVEIPTP